MRMLVHEILECAPAYNKGRQPIYRNSGCWPWRKW